MTLADAYARALVACATARPDDAAALVAALRASLARRGHLRLLPSIIRACERLLQFRALSQPRLVLARPDDATALEKEISAACAALGLSGAPALREMDPTLIGGFVLTDGARRWDTSHKRALIALYDTLRRAAAADPAPPASRARTSA